MKRIILTSDKYSFCLEGYQTLLERHWKDPEAEFTILGFKEPTCKLNDNVKFESFGNGLNDASSWQDTVKPYVENLEEDYFFIAFDDHFLVGDVNLELFAKAEEIMKNDETVGKVRLLPKYNYRNDKSRVQFNSLPDYDDDFHIGPTAPNTFALISLRPSIWRKSLFLRLCNNPGGVKNCHHFEKMNKGINFSDEKVILPKGSHPIYPDIDAMRHGKPNPQAAMVGTVNMDYYNQPLSAEDVKVFQETNKKWKNR
jgi:hypothetical protein